MNFIVEIHTEIVATSAQRKAIDLKKARGVVVGPLALCGDARPHVQSGEIVYAITVSGARTGVEIRCRELDVPFHTNTVEEHVAEAAESEGIPVVGPRGPQQLISRRQIAVNANAEQVAIPE